MYLLDNLPKRFKTKVKIMENGCWEWMASKSHDGYGRYGLHSDYVYAHRFSYEYFFKAIPAGMQLDHLCRNTACVNPDHLELVTPQVNILRSNGISAINARKITCINGHEFNLFNTYIDKNGKRYCRECDRIKHQKQRDSAHKKETANV